MNRLIFSVRMYKGNDEPKVNVRFPSFVKINELVTLIHTITKARQIQL